LFLSIDSAKRYNNGLIFWSFEANLRYQVLNLRYVQMAHDETASHKTFGKFKLKIFDTLRHQLLCIIRCFTFQICLWFISQ